MDVEFIKRKADMRLSQIKPKNHKEAYVLGFADGLQAVIEESRRRLGPLAGIMARDNVRRPEATHHSSPEGDEEGDGL